MSAAERQFTGESIDDIQADEFVREHLGAIEPDRLVEDDKPPRLRQSIVVGGNPPKEAEVFESNSGRSILDPFNREARRNTQEDREIGRNDPSTARVLQKSDRIGDDAGQTRPLVCIGGVRVPVADHELALFDVGPDHWEMGRAIREKQEGLREDVNLFLNPTTDHLA